MGRPVIDMHGFSVGKLTVTGFAGTDRREGQSRAYWNVVCTCGTEKQISGAALRTYTIRSCGCSQSAKRRRWSMPIVK